jgi:DNA-binding beta-propeller fold protein YncE
VVAIAAGYYQSLALKGNGTVVAWGDTGTLTTNVPTGYGDTNVPSGLANVVAIAEGGFHSLALKNDGTVVAWGYNGQGQTNVLSGLTNVVAIAGSYVDSLALSHAPPAVPPAITQQPTNQTVVVGATATFSVTATGTLPLSYQWYFNETNLLAGATDTSLILTNVQLTNAGIYSVLVTNAFGSATSSNAVLTVLVPPTVSITNPVNNASFNASRVNVSGNFTAASLKQITVNGILAFVDGTNFKALNVPLNANTNIITAIIENFTGVTNAASITVIGITNSDGSMNDPVQLQATPVAGFTPLPVTFSVQTNVPGTIQQVLYDFNGDGIADFVTNNLDSITYTYATNGEYFPVVTIQTRAGLFSSSGGWNSTNPNRLQINVQGQIIQLSVINITDPVDIKWVSPGNLYVLSGSTATITELDTNGNTIRSLSGIGSSPSGLDVDAPGNVYVAVTGGNQVWKFNPTTSSFTADTNFGIGGFIGLTNGTSGTTNGVFNAPFDVAVTPDGQSISVSDSGNNRIQQFSTTNGTFIAAFGTNGSAVGQFNTPEGLTYDSVGTLYIVDSRNNRIALAESSLVLGVSGTNGTALGQFSAPVGISVGERGVYVADTGNNRIQCFNPLANGVYSFAPSDIRFGFSTNFNQPFSVAAVDNLTNEMFYVADTGNNRVVLCKLPTEDPTPPWNNMTNHVATGDVSGAVSSFCSDTADAYRQSFLVIGTADLISDINQIGTLTPVFIKNDTAEYYFEKNIEGHTILFPVEFMKENGVWKIISF